MSTHMRNILGVIVLGLCGIWQIGVCGGQTADAANPRLQSSEPAPKAASPEDAKATPAAEQATLGAFPNLSKDRQTLPSPSVTLTWKASASVGKRPSDPVVGYNVYRRLKLQPFESKPINPAPVEDTTYLDVNVEPGNTYCYVVRTLTRGKVESLPSNEAEAEIPPR